MALNSKKYGKLMHGRRRNYFPCGEYPIWSG